MRSCILFVFTIIATMGYSQLKLSYPLKGKPGKDFYVDYFVDHEYDPDKISDAYCGTKTYDGHKGTDFRIRDFAKMDSGVIIYAAADGIVIATRDGNSDRSKHWVKGRPWNFVGISTNDKFYITYGHFMKSSLLVKKGDTVKRGQPLGKVGSSGFSSFPHVHIEVRNEWNKVLDPLSGNCHTDSGVAWVYPLPYDTLQYCISSGFVPYKPGYDTLLEGYLVKDSFSIREDTTVCFWLQMHALKKGDQLKYEWITPRNSLWRTYHLEWKKDTWHDYCWNYIKMPDKTGEWKVRFYINEKLITSGRFFINDPK